MAGNNKKKCDALKKSHPGFMTAKDDIILNLLIISNFGVFCGLNSGRVLNENRKLASSENY